jgi:hypothetical protein
VVVTIIFPATASDLQPSTVSNLDLTKLMTAPQKAAVPTALLPDAQYTGTIAWHNNTTNAAHNSSMDFAGNTIYKATLTLTAQSGYTFNGVAANNFRYTGATTIENAAGSGNTMNVVITFPATGDLVNLTGLVVTPGDKQVSFTWTDSTDQVANHVEISWTSVTGTGTVDVREGVQAETVTGLANGTEYTFTFTTVGDAQGRSAPVSVTVTPRAPTGLVKVEFTGLVDEIIDLNKFFGSDDLSWQANTGISVSVGQPGGYFSAFRWELDGVPINGITGSSLQLSAGSLSVRQHQLTVFATRNGLEYAKELIFTVKP